jgi:O-antigen ligase
MAFLALLTIHWQESGSKLLSWAKVATVGLGLGITFLSQSRGGWLALPMYALIAGAMFFHHARKATVSVLVAAFLFIFCAAIFSKNIQGRIEDVKNDVTSYMKGGDKDTSVGLRFQFWQSALVIIREHPIVGIGSDGFEETMTNLAKRGIVTPVAATFPHCHNEILFETVRYGIFGFLAIVAVLFIPLGYFFQDIKHCDKQVRTTAAMGATFCLAIFTFGLTDVVLIWRETATFYVFFMAVLFAYIVRRKQEVSAMPIVP